MKAFFSVLSHNVVTLLLSLAIVAGLSYYLLSYVPERTASLNARYFRVLARIGENVKDKIDAQHLNDEGDARSIAHLMSYRLKDFWKDLYPHKPIRSDYCPSGFVKDANQILADRPGPEKYHIGLANAEGAYKYSLRLDSVKNQFIFGYIVPPAPEEGETTWRKDVPPRQVAAKPARATTYQLLHTMPVDTLIRELRRPDVFDYFFVVELPSYRVLSSSGPTDFYLAGADAKASKRRLPRWLADSSLVHTGRAGAFLFGGQEYQLFAQPVQLGPRLSYLLVGGVAGERFNSERRALPPGGFELLTGLLLLSVLALPFLKPLLMSAREQIYQRDVLLSAASLVLGSGVLLLTLQAFMFTRETKRLVSRQLTDLAEDVANDLHWELGQLNSVVWQMDSSLIRQPYWQFDHFHQKRFYDSCSRVMPMIVTRKAIEKQFRAFRKTEAKHYNYPPPPFIRGNSIALGTIPSIHSLSSRTLIERGFPNGKNGDNFTWMTKSGRALYELDPTVRLKKIFRHSAKAIDEKLPEDALTKALNVSYRLPSFVHRKYLRKLGSSDYQLIRDDVCEPDLNPDEPRQVAFRWRTTRPILFGASNALTDSATDGCYFEMLRTVRNISLLRDPHPSYEGEAPHLQAVLARPSRWQDSLVCVFVTRLLCFDNKVIPPGYGFCLIEPNGEVLAHSNPDLNLSENLLADCEPNRELRAVLYAQQQQPRQAIEVIYQGRPTLLYVRPLAGMGRYLVTFFDMKYAKAQQSQTSLLALVLLSGFWLLAALVALLNWLLIWLARPATHQGVRRNQFLGIWPQPTDAARYWRVVVGQVIALLALRVVAEHVGPLSQLALLVIAPLPLLVLTYYNTRQPNAHQRTVFARVAGLIGLLLAGLLLVLLADQQYQPWRLINGNETAWLVSFGLGLSALVALLLRDAPAAKPALEYNTGGYRVAYVGILLGWIWLLGIVPALNCYRVAHLVERLQQVRAGQLQILKAYEQSEIQRETDVKYLGNRFLLNRFYYHTKFFFDSEWAKSDRITSYRSDPAEEAVLRFFTGLRTPMTQTGEEAVKALFVDATPNAQWHPWQVSCLADTSLTVTSQDNSGRSQVSSRLAGLQMGWPHLRRDLRSDEWLAPYAWWLLVALWWTFIVVGLWTLVSYLLRRLLGLSDEAIVRHQPLTIRQRLSGAGAAFSALFRRLTGLRAKAVDESAAAQVGASVQALPATDPSNNLAALPAGPLRRFWVLPAGSAWADVPTWARKKLGLAIVLRDYRPATLRQLLTQQAAPAVIILDCRQLFGPAPYTSQRATVAALLSRPAPSAQPPTIVLASFDYRLTDTDLTKSKVDLLNELQQRGWPLVVLSASHPEAFGDCGHPFEKPCPDTGHRPIREAGERLLDALGELQLEYFALQSAALEPRPDVEELFKELVRDNPGVKDDQALKEFFEEECQAFPFVAGLRPVLLDKLWQQHLAGQPVGYGTIETAVQRLAQLHFRRLWLALSPQEKFLLFDLAQDGLVNTDNGRALGILLQKGFLRRENNGRLSLRSASFRGFILTAQRKREAMQYVARSEQGTWAATQTPLLLLLAAGALFMFITQPTTFTQTQAFLVGLAGLVPALAGLIRFLLTPKPAAGAAAS